MIKLIQTGDVHLGAKFEGFGQRGATHRRQLEKVFERIIQTAIDKKVDFLLITGELFDSDFPSQNAVDFARRQIERLGKESIMTVIIPGNHDFLSDKSIYRKSFWTEMKNVFVFNNPEIKSKEFPDMDLTIYAKILTTKNSTASAILGADLSSAKHHLMMAHGSFIASDGSRGRFFDQWPITPQEIKNSKMDYIAIGNFHGMQDVSQGLPGQGDVFAWYAGSPEALAFDQKNSGFILYVEIGGEDVKIDPIKVGERKFDQIDIALDNIADAGVLKRKILENANVDLVRKAVLSGFIQPDIFIDEESLESELGEQFFKLIIIDKSVPFIPNVDEGKYSKNLIIGQFVLLAKEKIEKAESDEEKDVMQKSLQLGLSEMTRG